MKMFYTYFTHILLSNREWYAQAVFLVVAILTLLLAFAISIVISAGFKKTCDTIKDSGDGIDSWENNIVTLCSVHSLRVLVFASPSSQCIIFSLIITRKHDWYINVSYPIIQMLWWEIVYKKGNSNILYWVLQGITRVNGEVIFHIS